MTAILNQTILSSIEEEIQFHPAWLGQVSGLKAEKLLRGKSTPYLYVLRAGETEHDYYVTFVAEDLSVKHQPFVITPTIEGWYCENGCAFGPFAKASIEDVLHLIMHCSKKECKPLIA